MNIAQYDYVLPKELVAEYPPKKRGESKLLVLSRTTGEIQDKTYSDIEQFLCPGDTIVFNNTKVIRARFLAVDSQNKERELLLLEKHQKENDWFSHDFLCRGQVKQGDVFTIHGNRVFVSEIKGGGVVTLTSDVSFLELAKKHGEVPIPPYLKRSAEAVDRERYQTVWAQISGSVAAPTASLNMTAEIIEKLRKKQVNICYLTLHVGLGTFLPIRDNELEKHKMHKEFFEIPHQTVQTIITTKRRHGRVFAAGTTVARALEYSASKIYSTSLDNSIIGEADNFIYPGYEFKIVDGLLTNYHAPKSTVLMLASAFAGWKNLKKAYQHAIKERYKFLSYGDSMLII